MNPGLSLDHVFANFFDRLHVMSAAKIYADAGNPSNTCRLGFQTKGEKFCADGRFLTVFCSAEGL